MAVVGLDHVQLAIPEGGEDQARQFFGTLLGMREVPKPSTLSPCGCWFESGGASVHIGIDPDFVPARKAHPAFLVRGLDDLRARLEEAGFETKNDKPIDGVDRFFTADPFGNRIDLMERREAKPVD